MTDERLPWFQCYPSKLLDALGGLTSDQKLVYMVTLLRIYDARGPIPDSVEAIATRCGFSRRRAAEALDALFRLGKLLRVDGGIHNPKAIEVIAEGDASAETRRRVSKEGGKKSAQKRKEKQRIGPTVGTPSVNRERLRDREKEGSEGSKEDSLFPDGNRAPAAPVYADSRHELWGEGIPILIQLGVPEKRARQMVGRWLKDAGDDASRVLASIQRARDNRVTDPIPWVTRAIETNNGGNHAADRTSGPASGQRRGRGFAAYAVARARAAGREGS